MFERTLQYLVVTKDLQNRFSDDELEEMFEVSEVDICPLPTGFINELFSENKPITIFQDNVRIEGKAIKIPFSLTKFDFQKQQEYRNDGILSYDFVKNQWMILWK